MKFIKDVASDLLVIPRAALQLGRFENEKVEIHSLMDTIVIVKGQMTAMELVNAIAGLIEFASELTDVLSETCTGCDSAADCPFTSVEEITLPNELLEEAGIPLDAKLSAYTDEENGSILIEEAEYSYDLKDVPPSLLDSFKEFGFCLEKLKEHLQTEDIIYGK